MYVKSVYTSGVGDISLGQSLSITPSRASVSEPTRYGTVTAMVAPRRPATKRYPWGKKVAALPKAPRVGVPRPRARKPLISAKTIVLPRPRHTVVVRPSAPPPAPPLSPASIPGSSSSPINPGPSGAGGGTASYGGGAAPSGGGSVSYGGGDGGWPPSWADEGLIDEPGAEAEAPEAPAAPAKKPMSTVAKVGLGAAAVAAVLYAMYS